MGLISQWAEHFALWIWLVVGIVCYRAGHAALLYKQRQALKEKFGVQEAIQLPQSRFLRGLDTAQASLKAIEEHRFLALLDKYFQHSNRTTLQFYNAGRHMHMTIDPQNLRVIHLTEHKKWQFNRRRKAGFSLLLGKGIFTVDGMDWKYSHDLLRPNFERLQMINLDPSESHLFFSFSMDISIELLLGTSTNTQRNTDVQEFSAAFNRSQNDACKRVHLGWWYYALNPLAARKARKDVQIVHSFVDDYVDRAITATTHGHKQKQSGSLADGGDHALNHRDRYVFLDELVKCTRDPVRIRSELLNILLAGRDTTASLLTNLWFILSKRPDIWTKLQAEVTTLCGKKPTYQELKTLGYLHALINESLRLHPVVPYNTREAVENTILPRGGGREGKSPIFVKKGELVAWSLFSMHRRKDFFGEDADKFAPERWLHENRGGDGMKGNISGWEFLPFHRGPRSCMGQSYAKTQAAYVTVRLCQEFDKLTSASDYEWGECLTLTLVNLHGAKVYLGPRYGE